MNLLYFRKPLVPLCTDTAVSKGLGNWRLAQKNCQDSSFFLFDGHITAIKNEIIELKPVLFNGETRSSIDMATPINMDDPMET